MRFLLTFLACATLGTAQSHPTWWTYASPNATALVGIEWRTVRASPFAEPVEAELWGDLGFPDLPVLHSARQIIISSPDMLALVSGTFSTIMIQEQAARKLMKPMTYRGVDMWFAGEKGALSVAHINDQLLIIGDPKTLEMAVDRGLGDSKNYSPLLARAAKFAKADLWVVASQLPDDLANRFVPLEIEAQSFEGSLSVRNGLELEATATARSEQEAAASAENLRKAAPTFPAIARALEVTVDQESIQLALTATREKVVAALRGPEPVAPTPATIKMETPREVQQVSVEKPKPITEKSVVKPVEKSVEKPQIIRIVGLDDGPREIVLPPEKKNP